MVLNVAFYGAGPLAQPYLEVLGRRRDVRLSAVCDVDRRAAEQTAAGWGARLFLSYEAMLEEAAPDVLWICVPPHLQGDVILRAAERAIPFFVEPPGAVDYERARQYARAVEQARLVTAVGFSGRHADVVQEAREYLGTNPIPLALGWWLCPPSDDGLSTTAVGQLWTDACRLVDGMRVFCGAVTRVRALTAGGGTAAGGLVLQLEFVSGTVGMVTCAAFARPEPRIELELLGEGWSLSFGRDLATLRLDERDKTTILRCLNRPAEHQTTAFLEAVMHDRPGGTNYAEAMGTLAICHAAGVSASEGRPVPLAELEQVQDSPPEKAAEPSTGGHGGG
jgi:predicted dehydrogenase